MDIVETVVNAANDIRESKEAIQTTAKTMLALEIATGIICVLILTIIVTKK